MAANVVVAWRSGRGTSARPASTASRTLLATSTATMRSQGFVGIEPLVLALLINLVEGDADHPRDRDDDADALPAVEMYPLHRKTPSSSLSPLEVLGRACK